MLTKQRAVPTEQTDVIPCGLVGSYVCTCVCVHAYVCVCVCVCLCVCVCVCVCVCACVCVCFGGACKLRSLTHKLVTKEKYLDTHLYMYCVCTVFGYFLHFLNSVAKKV